MRDFNYKKKFGQNFLKNDGIVEKIALKSQILEDTMVVEVGPGKGILTKQLSKYAKNVLCYEIDEELQYDLIKLQEKYSNVDVKFCDFLCTNLMEDLKEYLFKIKK